jgi:hypothetical protein
MRIKTLVLGALLLFGGIGCYHTAGICDCTRNGVLPLCGSDGPYGAGYEHGIHVDAPVHAGHAAPVVTPNPAQLK